MALEVHLSLHAAEFFAELQPAFPGAVVGNTYYGIPVADSPVRIRIDFQSTIRHREYDGLRLAVLHPDRGTLDTVFLSFADHQTFARRDAATGIGPGRDGYARFRDWHETGPPPWKGADLTGLRRGITHYTQVWAPAPAPDHSRPSLPTLPTARPASGRSR
ncbi:MULTISPECIES: hypothetical protein [Streptomyces]|uniref:hypothetical protein n=1 Tax=Streptomyces TaxID=1883 RepID=UPI00224C7F45|nr:hypothetical protein [Streptomyces erythrochromogenes]MCX5583017.1 hypothetical protein [Streptomyces erythrochromogenes]